MQPTLASQVGKQQTGRRQEAAWQAREGGWDGGERTSAVLGPKKEPPSPVDEAPACCMASSSPLIYARPRRTLVALRTTQEAFVVSEQKITWSAKNRIPHCASFFPFRPDDSAFVSSSPFLCHSSSSSCVRNRTRAGQFFFTSRHVWKLQRELPASCSSFLVLLFSLSVSFT